VSIQADIAVAAVEETGIVVTRIDPRTGRTVWSSHHATVTGDGRPGNALLQRIGTGLVVRGADRAWSLSAQGQLGREWDERTTGGRGWSFQEHASGHPLLWSYENNGSGSATMTDLETGATITTPSGTYPASGVDDGSVAGLLLTRGPGVTAYDLATGKVRWESPGPVDDLMVLDGVVYAVGVGSVRAQDADTGEVLWDRRTSFVGFDRIATDGRSLLVLDPPKDNHSALVALDLRDGSVQWTAPLTQVAQNLVVIADRLFVQNAEGSYSALG